MEVIAMSNTQNQTQGTRRQPSIFAIAALSTFAASVLPATACDTCQSPFKPGTYTGEAKRVGNGVAYSWVVLNEKGKPSSLGITLTETALEGLPQTPPKGKLGPEFNLSLPKQAMKTAFQHISLGWNPLGHEPPGIYDKAHFDFHFYLIGVDDREKITATGADIVTCRKAVPAGFSPAGYIYAKGTEVPMMGGHWVDPKAPELNGQPFTTTFLYGSYDGKMIHFEPMITKAFLESKPDFHQDIAIPTAYRKSGYYPTRYSVRYDPVRREFTIALEGMTWREAADKAPAAKVVRSATQKTATAGKVLVGKPLAKGG
jgi:hypothetical protein